MADVKFGPRPSYASDGDFEFSVAPDRQTFTVTFSDLIADVDAGKPPVVPRVFSLVLPVQGGGNGVNMSFVVSSYAFTTKSASGYAVLSANGKTSVQSFPSGVDQDYVQELKLEAGATSDCRLVVFLLAERVSGDRDAVANLNVSSIDGKVSPRGGPGPATYTVVNGDSLSKIAAKLRFPGGWEALYRLNRSVIGPDPNKIYPGQVLRLR